MSEVWVSVAVLFVGSLVVAEVGRRGVQGKLPRHHIAGIRLPSTMRDDESWRVAHLAGGPAMCTAGMAVAILSLVAAFLG